MKTVIEMAREAGFMVVHEGEPEIGAWYECFAEEIERFAELIRADEAKRSDALAATIAALRDIVTNDIESKADFIARVRDVLGACPDQRVLHAVAAEREACAKVIDEMAEDMVREMEPSTAIAYVRSKAAAIRARGETK